VTINLLCTMRSTGHSRDRMFGLAGSSRRREEVGEYVRGSLWVLPGIAALAALVAGSVLSLVPVPRDGLLYKLVFQGTPDDARTLLIETAGAPGRKQMNFPQYPSKKRNKLPQICAPTTDRQKAVLDGKNGLPRVQKNDRFVDRLLSGFDSPGSLSRRQEQHAVALGTRKGVLLLQIGGW
jgi:hypothetical protein